MAHGQAVRIRKLVDRALQCFFEGELEDALMQLAPALEATAKNRYPSEKPSPRTKRFLKDERDLIYGLSTQFRFCVEGDGALIHGTDGELHRIIYKFIRCAQAHEAQIDFSKIVLGGDFGVARIRISGASLEVPPDKYLISSATVFSLIFLVVVAKENKQLPKTGLNIDFLGEQLSVDDYLGDKQKFMNLAMEKFVT